MSIAMVLAHPNLTAAAAIEVARRDGLRIVQTTRGNFIYEPSSAAPMAGESGSVLPALRQPSDAAGPLEAA